MAKRLTTDHLQVIINKVKSLISGSKDFKVFEFDASAVDLSEDNNSISLDPETFGEMMSYITANGHNSVLIKLKFRYCSLYDKVLTIDSITGKSTKKINLTPVIVGDDVLINKAIRLFIQDDALMASIYYITGECLSNIGQGSLNFDPFSRSNNPVTDISDIQTPPHSFGVYMYSLSSNKTINLSSSNFYDARYFICNATTTEKTINFEMAPNVVSLTGEYSIVVPGSRWAELHVFRSSNGDILFKYAVQNANV